MDFFELDLEEVDGRGGGGEECEYVYVCAINWPSMNAKTWLRCL